MQEVIFQWYDSYIGKTGRLQNYKSKGYIRSQISPNLPSYADKPFARDRVKKSYDGVPDLEIHMLAVSGKIFESKVKALEIRDRRPAIDKRNELATSI